MKTNKNTQLKTQIKIVKTLLDGSYKSQRQIAAEINREESTVSKALSYLKDVILTEERIIISGGRSNKGLYKNKLCHLSYEVEKGIHILNFYKNVFTEKTLSRQEEAEIFKTLTEEDKFISIIMDQEGKDILLLESTPTLKNFLKQMLQLSPTFLEEILLMVSFDNFKKTWLELNPWLESSSIKMTTQDIDQLIYLELAKHSVLKDGVKSNDMQKVRTFIKKTENQDGLNFIPMANVVTLFLTAINKCSENSKKMEEKLLEEVDPEVMARIRDGIEEESKRRKQEYDEEWLKTEDGNEWLKKHGLVRAESLEVTQK
jgi:hypothetical protein